MGSRKKSKKKKRKAKQYEPMSGDSDSQATPAEHSRGMDRVPESGEDGAEDGDGEASADTADNNATGDMKVRCSQKLLQCFTLWAVSTPRQTVIIS